MKFRTVLSGTLALAAGLEVQANNSDHAIEFGISYLDASGFNAYGTDTSRNLFEGLEQNNSVPYIGYRFTNNNWRLRVGYQDYGRFTRDGIAPDSNIFSDQGVGLQVITSFLVKEDITNFNVDLTRLFPINDHWTFEAGPSINFTKQRASVTNTTFQVNALKKNRNSEQLGALVGLNYALNDQFDVSMNYRFNQASKLDLHTVGVNLAWTF